MTLRDLADEMHTFKKENRMCGLLQEAFSLLPEPVLTYAEAYRRLVRNEVEKIPVAEAGNRIAATGIVPYPPGIPLLAPGERTGAPDAPVLRYLMTMQEFDRRFPGFEHDTHGIENVNGTYMMNCIVENRP
jgi:arginine/lysine/ornithine decarboxylase